MSVVHEFIASYTRCFVQMLPAIRRPAHFITLVYFISILLSLVVALPLDIPRLYAYGTLVSLWHYLELQWTIHTSRFTKKVLSEQI